MSHSRIPATTTASRTGSSKKPGTLATTRAETRSRCHRVVALAVAQPSANSQKTSWGREIGNVDEAGLDHRVAALVGDVPAVARRLVAGLDADQVLLALVVGEPRDLERAVAFDEPALVIVDRFAGAREQPGGGVVVAEDEVGVRLARLERNADRHLADRAAGEPGAAADRLRPEHHVHAERAALADEPVDQHRCVLRQLVVLAEELLELVDDQQRARHQATASTGSTGPLPTATGFAMYRAAFRHRERLINM